MYKRMLVALDGSELAEVALGYARELSGRLDINVVLLHVYGPGERELVPMRRAYLEREAEKIGQQSEQVQRKTGGKSSVKPRALDVTADLVMGNPAEEIVRYAEERDIDFILMATHGRSGIRRWALGSVADKVLRASSVPVLLVRAAIPDEIVRDRWPARTILVPLDGSELAESVLPHVEALAGQRGPERVEVVLIGVCEPMLLPSYYPPEIPLSWDAHVGMCKRSSGAYLAKTEKRLKEAGLNVRYDVLVGKAAEAIVDYATQHPSNLIVMATHGRSGLSRWALGSVAERVLLGVSSPIFLVRPH